MFQIHQTTVLVGLDFETLSGGTPTLVYYSKVYWGNGSREHFTKLMSIIALHLVQTVPCCDAAISDLPAHEVEEE